MVWMGIGFRFCRSTLVYHLKLVLYYTNLLVQHLSGVVGES